MTIGDGIFGAAVVIAMTVLFIATKDRWNWGKGIKRLALWGGILCVLLGLTVWGYVRFESRVTKQLQYYDLALGMTKAEVRYAQGTPNNVFEADKNEPRWQILIPTEKIDKGKSTDDFDEWSYKINDRVRLDVNFDKKSGKVKAISCFSQDNGQCRSILGVYSGSSEESLLDKFGKPDREAIEGPTKSMAYPNLNIAFYLTKKQVYMLIVSDSIKR